MFLVTHPIIMHETLTYLEIEHWVKIGIGIEDQTDSASLDIMPSFSISTAMRIAAMPLRFPVRVCNI